MQALHERSRMSKEHMSMGMVQLLTLDANVLRVFTVSLAVFFLSIFGFCFFPHHGSCLLIHPVVSRGCCLLSMVIAISCILSANYSMSVNIGMACNFEHVSPPVRFCLDSVMS